jgi:transcription initiation factor IIE alpha subunit
VIKLICKKCGKAWYTANTSSNQKCDDCGGTLEESEMIKKNKNTNKCSNAI